MSVQRLRRIGLNVAALAPACAEYRNRLGFVLHEQGYTPDWAALVGPRVVAARLTLGAQEIELVEWDPPGARYPPDSTAADLWFQHFAIVQTDIRQAVTRYPDHPISTAGPVQLPVSAGSVVAYKFRDACGHPLEFLQLPTPTATPRIDHSAISVADAARSIAFYAALGLAAGARGVNRGPTQQALDGLAAAEVEVIALHPPQHSPHVELLCYRTPRGRPSTPSAGGIADTRLEFDVSDLMQTFAALPSSAQRHGAVALLRDPDGHAILLREAAT